MKTILALSSALALTLAACGQSAPTDSDAGTAAANLTTKADGTETATETEVVQNGAVAITPTTAAEFVNEAAAGDQFEIQSSQLAATKAGSAAVKEYAAMLVTEHTKSTEALKAAGLQSAPAVTPAATLNAEQQANITALRNAPNGAEFDKLYAQVQVPAHENTLALMQGYSVRGDQPMLKMFASRTARVVQKHLEEARRLAQ